VPVKLVMLTCRACNTVSTKDLNEVFFCPNMELSVLDQLLQCPECGYRNGGVAERKLVVATSR
jgi:hypothetical protein